MGDLELPVPIYSAIKKGGKKLYEYAREGKEVQIPKKTMRFYNLEAHILESNLLEADLSDADLSDADLLEADLSEAGLSEADLSEADLSEADLSDADLSEADLSEAILSKNLPNLNPGLQRENRNSNCSLTDSPSHKSQKIKAHPKPYPFCIDVKMSCSKGSFVRSWAHQLGCNLGSGAYVDDLRRISSGTYQVNRAIPLSDLNLNALQFPHFIPLNDCFASYQTLTIKGRNEHLMMNGQIPIEITQRLTYQQKQANLLGRSYPIRLINSHGELLSLLSIKPFQGLKIKKVFNAKQKKG